MPPKIIKLILFLLYLTSTPLAAQQAASPSTPIKIASILDLSGQNQGVGTAVKKGIEAAIRGQLIGKHPIQYQAYDDQDDTDTALKIAQQLIKNNTLAMLGNTGTASAEKLSPLLKTKSLPAIGFISGSAKLRGENVHFINIRASVKQEIHTMIQAAHDNQITAGQICAFIEQSAFGLSELSHIIESMRSIMGTKAQPHLDAWIKVSQAGDKDRNNIGPVGFYPPKTLLSRPGYQSLKRWEKQTGQACKMIISLGHYASIARFIAYSKKKGEKWIYSTTASSGATAFRETLERFRATDRVLMTQVMPPRSNKSLLMQQAKQELRDNFSHLSFEGYISAQLFIHAARALHKQGRQLNRQNLLQTLQQKSIIDLNGIELDFRTSNQGMNNVSLTALTGIQWHSIDNRPWQGWGYNY